VSNLCFQIFSTYAALHTGRVLKSGGVFGIAIMSTVGFLPAMHAVGLYTLNPVDP
jgi:hypothetical protein